MYILFSYNDSGNLQLIAPDFSRFALKQLILQERRPSIESKLCDQLD